MVANEKHDRSRHDREPLSAEVRLPPGQRSRAPRRRHLNRTRPDSQAARDRAAPRRSAGRRRKESKRQCPQSPGPRLTRHPGGSGQRFGWLVRVALPRPLLRIAGLSQHGPLGATGSASPPPDPARPRSTLRRLRDRAEHPALGLDRAGTVDDPHLERGGGNGWHRTGTVWGGRGSRRRVQNRPLVPTPRRQRYWPIYEEASSDRFKACRLSPNHSVRRMGRSIPPRPRAPNIAAPPRSPHVKPAWDWATLPTPHHDL
jgi:hypothetical protein